MNTGPQVPFLTDSSHWHKEVVCMQVELDHMNKKNHLLVRERDAYKYKCSLFCLDILTGMNRDVYNKLIGSIPVLFSNATSGSAIQALPLPLLNDANLISRSLFNVDHTSWPKATDFTEEEWLKIFRIKAQWLV